VGGLPAVMLNFFSKDLVVLIIDSPDLLLPK